MTRWTKHHLAVCKTQMWVLAPYKDRPYVAERLTKLSAIRNYLISRGHR